METSLILNIVLGSLVMIGFMSYVVWLGSVVLRVKKQVSQMRRDAENIERDMRSIIDSIQKDLDERLDHLDRKIDSRLDRLDNYQTNRVDTLEQSVMREIGSVTEDINNKLTHEIDTVSREFEILKGESNFAT
jgi:uncharacterized protein YoxC